MKQQFLLFISISTLLLSCNTNAKQQQETTPSTKATHEIPFEWESFEVNGKTYKHGAMFVPVTLDQVDKSFKMQFDLGLNVSAIYENPLQTILAKHPLLKDKVKIGPDHEVLKIQSSMGSYKATVDSLFIFKAHGSQATYDHLKTIGSIGANEIENKILIIDFKNTKLKIVKDTNELRVNDYEFVPLTYKHGKIFIPLSINGKTYDYIYDTGASITPITTIDRNFFNYVSNNATQIDTIHLQSWGQSVPFIKAKINTPIQLGTIKMDTNEKSIFFTDNPEIIETLQHVQVQGLVGNDFFINQEIVIDLIHNKFGVRKN